MASVVSPDGKIAAGGAAPGAARTMLVATGVMAAALALALAMSPVSPTFIAGVDRSGLRSERALMKFFQTAIRFARPRIDSSRLPNAIVSRL